MAKDTQLRTDNTRPSDKLGKISIPVGGSKPAEDAGEGQQKQEKGRVMSPQYEEQEKKEESLLDKVKAGLATGGGDVSVDPAGVDSATFKAVVDLQSIDSALTLSQSILEKSKNFAFETIQDQMMSPTELAALMQNPNLKEYSQQVYQIEKEKFDASQAMGRNIALSLIGQVFSSASGVKGKVATSGMDTFKAGADTIQANQDAVMAQNRLVDKANQDATAAMNTNFLEYVKDHNKYETDIVKDKNRAIYNTYQTNVNNMREILNKGVDADIQTSKTIESGMKEREANKRKVEEINANITIANLDSKTKLAVANIDSRTKVAIANQANRVAEYRAVLEAVRLDRDEENKKYLSMENAYKDTVETLFTTGANPVLVQQSMHPIDSRYVDTWADTDGVSMAGFKSALTDRMTSWGGLADPQMTTPEILGTRKFWSVGKDWDTDGASLINASMILNRSGAVVDPEAWKGLNALSNEELNSMRISEKNGKPVIVGTGRLKDVIDNLELRGLISFRKFKNEADKNTRATQWTLAIGSNLKYDIFNRVSTEAE